MKSICIALFSLTMLVSLTIDTVACSCRFGGASPCEEYWRMEVVFIGTVTKIATVPKKEGAHEYQNRLVSFAVGERFRGIHAEQAEALTGLGGGDCGYSFRVGETYLVYAYRDKENGQLGTSICTRTRALAQATDDLNYIRNLASAVPGGVIFGKVHKQNFGKKEGEDFRTPVTDAEISLEGGSTRLSTRTDMQGSFRLTGLPQGKYKVTLKFPKGLADGADGEALVADREVEVAEKGCAEVGFWLQSDTRVSGRLLDAAGNPVEKIRLEMRGASSDLRNHNTFLSAWTYDGGRFLFRTVPPGDYLLGLRILESSGGEILPYRRTYYPGVVFKAQAGVITVKEGEHLSNLEIRLPPRLSEYTVEGYVVWADGRPAPGASVSLGMYEDGEFTASQTVYADERGRFTLKAYEGMKYKVSAYPLNASGPEPQSKWVELPTIPGGEPVRLVLPILRK